MAIVRAKRQSNYTIIGNVGLRDNQLSLKAKGLLAYMLSLPDDWIFYETELTKHCTDGRDSIRSALKELEKLGYLVREQKRAEKGKFGEKDWKVYDDPISVESPLTENPSTDNPTADNPSAENPTLLNTNQLSTDEPSTKLTKDNTSNPDSTILFFETIWKKYPKKTMKKEALAAVKRAIKKGVSHEEIEKGLDNYIAHLESNKTWLKPMDGGRWFKKERWGDEYEQEKNKQRSGGYDTSEYDNLF